MDVNEAVSKIDFSKFCVSTDLSDYDFVESERLCDLQAKHIIVRNKQTEKIYQEAISGGHKNIMWGNLRNGTVESERTIIDKMIADDFHKSIRITVTSDHIWSDNNHSTIAYILRGCGRVCDVPHYIVDVRSDKRVLIGTHENIVWDYDCILDAIRRSYRLRILEENGGRKTPWTIGDLMKQIRL